MAIPAVAQERRSFEHEQIVEQRFTVRPGQALHLDTDRGSVSIRGSEGDEVRVTVIKGVDGGNRSRAQELFDRFVVSFDQTSSGIVIDGDHDQEESFWRRIRSNLHVLYEIEVPYDFDVDVRTSGGSVSVAALQGKAELRTSGGSVSARDVAGTLAVNTSGGSISVSDIGGEAQLRTSGGSITARQVDGPLECHTSGGSITVERVKGDVRARTSGGGIRLSEIYGAADAHTSGGSISAELVGQPEQPVKLQTSGGSVTLYLDPQARLDIDAEAWGGTVKTDLPVAVRGEIERGRLQGSVNGGGPLLTLRSSGGSIRIHER